MNTTTSPGIEAAVADVFLEIYQPVAAVQGLQVASATASTKAGVSRLTIRVQATGEEAAVRIPGGHMASLLEVTLHLDFSSADRDEEWLKQTVLALEKRRNSIGSFPLQSTAPFSYFEILENGAQAFGFDNDKTLKQFAVTVCAALK